MIDFGTILWLIAGFGVLFAAAALAGCRHGCHS